VAPSPQSVAEAIFDGVERGEEEIFPDAMSINLADSWRTGAAQEFEHQFAAFVNPPPPAANVFPFVPPEGITVSGLAELAGVRKQTMAQAVDQLERTGYVERRPNPNDRRSRLVFLTERGASVPLVTHAAAVGVEERWAEHTTPEELEALRASLLRLLTELRADT
jgi:DNA-binding MarR family transcriptional regulator